MQTTRLSLSILVGAALIALAALQFMPRGGEAAAPVQPTSTSSHTISSWGHGQVAVKPNQASLVLGAQTRARQARTALASSNAKIDAVIKALTKQGVWKTHMQTGDLSIWYDSQSGMYVASHSLGVKMDRVDKVGSVLDAAIAAGANSSFGVSFGVKDQSAARATALKSAMADARKRATTIAQALGAKITETVAVNEATAGSVTTVAGLGVGGGGGGTAIQPGQYFVSADVNVTYRAG